MYKKKIRSLSLNMHKTQNESRISTYPDPDILNQREAKVRNYTKTY